MSIIEKIGISSTTPTIDKSTLEKAFSLMAKAKAMAEIYEKNAAITSKYVHATSRGHEAIQIAVGLQLLPQDYVSPYYRDDSILLSIGMRPYDCMLQLLAKRDDPFSGGRTYYCHPSLKDENKPKIIHQSSATGMQAIPTTGITTPQVAASSTPNTGGTTTRRTGAARVTTEPPTAPTGARTTRQAGFKT